MTIQKTAFHSYDRRSVARHWRGRARRDTPSHVDFARRKHTYSRERHRGAHDSGDGCRKGGLVMRIGETRRVEGFPVKIDWLDDGIRRNFGKRTDGTYLRLLLF